MNYNAYSVILSTLKIQGSLTRPQLWQLVRKTNLYPSSVNFKEKLDTLLNTERINRTSEYHFDPKKGREMKNLFKYEISESNERNQLPEDLLARVKLGIDEVLESSRLRAERENAQKIKQQEEREQLIIRSAEIKVQEKKKREDQEKSRIQHALEKSQKLYKK